MLQNDSFIVRERPKERNAQKEQKEHFVDSRTVACVRERADLCGPSEPKSTKTAGQRRWISCACTCRNSCLEAVKRARSEQNSGKKSLVVYSTGSCYDGTPFEHLVSQQPSSFLYISLSDCLVPLSTLQPQLPANPTSIAQLPLRSPQSLLRRCLSQNNLNPNPRQNQNMAMLHLMRSQHPAKCASTLVREFFHRDMGG